MARRNSNPTEESAENQQNTENNESGSDLGGTHEQAIGNAYASELLALVTKLPTAFRLGAQTRIPRYTALDPALEAESKVRQVNFAVAGGMVIDWIPTMGVSKDKTSALNNAFDKTYGVIRSKNSRSGAYEMPDLAKENLALDSLYTLYYEGARIYGLINKYSVLNAYYPEAIFRGMGLNYRAFAKDMTNFLARLTTYRIKLESFALPPTVQVYKDHQAMATQVYTDGEGDRTQMYIFKQKYYYSYEVVDEAKELQLVESTFSTPDEYFELFDRLINSFLQSEDVSIINAEIIRTWGLENTTHLAAIPADWVTPFVKDYSMMLGLLNANVVDVDPVSCAVRDGSNGVLLCEPTSKFISAGTSGVAVNPYNPPVTLGNNGIFNFITNEPSPAEILAASRFKVWIDESTIQQKKVYDTQGAEVFLSTYEFQHCGSEILVAMRFFTYDDNVYLLEDAPNGATSQGTILFTERHAYNPAIDGLNQEWREFNSLTDTSNYTDSEATGTNYGADKNIYLTRTLLTLQAISQFDWHPAISFVNFSVWGTSIDGSLVPTNKPWVVRSTPPFVDTQNLVPVGEDTIEQLTTARLFYEFYGPGASI